MSADTLAVARDLLAAGIPVVYCTANKAWRKGTKKPDLLPPKGWAVITGYEAAGRVWTHDGWAALGSLDLSAGCLAMVGGHGIDVMDIDSKAGGDPSYLPPIATYGCNRTPSGGWHFAVRSTGFAKVSPWRTPEGLVLGDYCGGTPQGGSRLLVYLGGHRPKYPRDPYRTETPWDVAGCMGAEPDPALIDMLSRAGVSRSSQPGATAATMEAVEAFLSAYPAKPERECHYGREAVASLLKAAHGTVPGDAAHGRHAWAVRTATRLVELIRAGCAGTDDLDAYGERLAVIKPEEDPFGPLAWALSNATGGVECGMHRMLARGSLPWDPDPVRAWMNERLGKPGAMTLPEIRDTARDVAAVLAAYDGVPEAAWEWAVGSLSVGRGVDEREAERAVREGFALGRAAPRPIEDGGGISEESAVTPPVPMPLPEAEAIFAKWLGDEYDLDAMRVALATIAVERLDGDPVWTLLVSGSGNAKTETVMACGVDAVMASTISSQGALLSATASKERAKDASGGLLRQLEPRGVMVIKDVTSILSMDRTARAEVLAALREVHDGSWDRPVGTDGGRVLSWAGRIAVLGAVTTAWDAAHAVIATMGDRFVLLRIDSTAGRAAAGRKAIGNTGHEATMRAELRAAAAGVLAGMSTAPGDLTEDEQEALMSAADLVTRARTGVEFDYKGNVIDAHAPEMPTRFAKELAQVLRGALAIGMPRAEANRLAIRVARDSMPPLRLAIIDDLAEHPDSTPSDVRKRIDKPWSTVDRQLQALHMLGVVEVDEREESAYGGGKARWYYRLARDIDPACLCSKPFTRNVGNPLAPSRERVKTESETGGTHTPTNKSGEGRDAPRPSGMLGLLRPCSSCNLPAVSDPCTDCRRAG